MALPLSLSPASIDMSTAPRWLRSLPAHLRSAQHRTYIILAVLAIVVFAILWPTSSSKSYPIPWRGSLTQTSSPRSQAANSTLGFEIIVALSKGPSWRTRGLDAAAKLIDIHIEYPQQPHNSQEFVQAFQSIGAGEEGKTTPQAGSANAWVAHLDLLKHVIASDFTTALIVEDDVDFDVDLIEQVQLVSDHVRAFTNVSADDPSPYGSDWDLLWLGHCGTITEMDTLGPRYLDPTRCRTELYSGWSKTYLRQNLEENHRILQWAGATTVCTFGYAVNRRTVQRVLELTSQGQDEAFDVALSHLCGAGVLRCLVVNPQIMNHYEPPREAGYVSPVHEGDGQGVGSDAVAFEHVMGTTGNIARSARCQALFGEVCMRPPSEI